MLEYCLQYVKYTVWNTAKNTVKNTVKNTSSILYGIVEDGNDRMVRELVRVIWQKEMSSKGWNISNA